MRVDLDSQQVLQVVDSLVQRSFTVFLSILEHSSFRFVITDGMLDSLKSSLANVSREGAADLICFIHVMNQSLHKVDQGNHQARKTHGKSSHGRVRLLLLQLPPSSPRHDTSHQSPPATALIFF